MRKFLALLATAAITASTAAGAADQKHVVKFAHGASSATIKGSTKGYDGVSYVLGANAGQTMSVLFEPDNASCYFNVNAPGQDAAMFIGSTSGNEYSGALPASGEYTALVYLMRNAARRDETCNYSITFEIAAAGGAAATAPAARSGASNSEEERRRICTGEAAGQYGVRPAYIATSTEAENEGRKIIDGTVDKGSEGIKKFRCIFNSDGSLADVMAMTSDGE